MKNTLIAVTVLTLCGLSQAAENASPTMATEKREEVIKTREENQQKRIEEGVKSGELTKGEVKKLENEQAKVKKIESEAMADGKVTKKEMRRIEKAQNHASEDIAKKKHNRRKQ
jgi:CRISPR/Cas system-associated endoribonuclease Cas2